MGFACRGHARLQLGTTAGTCELRVVIASRDCEWMLVARILTCSEALHRTISTRKLWCSNHPRLQSRATGPRLTSNR